MHKRKRSFGRQWRYGILAILLAIPLKGIAEEADEIAVLRQQIGVLQERLDVLEEQAAKSRKQESPQIAEPPSTITVDRRGLVVESPDRTFTFRFRPRIQVDANGFPDNGDGTSGIQLRRVRPVFEGKADTLDWRIMPELAGTVRILDAWGKFSLGQSLSLKVGKFKGIMGYERRQSFSQRLFIEPGMPFNQTPTREIGGELNGRTLDNRMEWFIGLYDGVLDNSDLSSNANLSDGVDTGASLAFHPWLGDRDSFLNGLTIGAAFTHGDENTVIDNSDRDRRIRYSTTGLNTFFRYNDNVMVDGTRQRANLFFSCYTGPFGFLGEYIRSTYDLSRGGVSRTVDTDGWTLQGSWVITGEHPSYKGFSPFVNFDWDSGNWGAFEVAMRLHHLAVGDEAFIGGTDTQLARQGSTQKATGYGFGVNWLLSANQRLSLNYETTKFSGKGDDRDTEEVLKSRFQLDF